MRDGPSSKRSRGKSSRANGQGKDSGLETLARFGFFARGIVYLVIGGVAARAAVLQRGRATGPAGALKTILQGWHGRVILGIVAAGLVSFLVFRIAQIARARGSIQRVVHLVSAIGIFLLAFSATRLLVMSRGRGSMPLREWGSVLLEQAWGPVALALGGAIAIIAGTVEVIRALLDKLPNDFAAASIAKGNKTATSRLARVGLLAHGIVIITIGTSVLRAGLEVSSRQLVGTGGAIRRLSDSATPALFVAISVGLMAYGASLIVLAAHRRRHLL
jgi:hypothetical protein